MKFCIIGWCGHSYYILEGLKHLNDLQIAGISSGIEGNDGSSIAAQLEQSGISFSGKFYSDWLSMLVQEKPDAVSVDGPFHQHGIMCLECAKRGIHVFCEKPISLDLAELEEIENAAVKSGSCIISMVGLRYDPAFWTAHQLAESGAIGKIKLIHTQKSYRFGNRPEFYKKRELYGGTIPWIGSHAIDWILWFSRSDFKSVTAFHDSHDNHGYESMEIAAECLFYLKNGIIATVSIDVLRPDNAHSHGDDRIRIAGTEGVLEVMDSKVHLINVSGDQYIELENPPRTLFEDFIGGIRKETLPPVSTMDTIALTRACLLARKAADNHTTEYFK